MKKITFLLFTLISLNSFSQVANWEWVQPYNGVTSPSFYGKICKDNNGNIIVAGDQGDGPGGGQWAFLAKYEPNFGNVIWNKSIGYTITNINDVCSDASGNIYIIGETSPDSGILIIDTISIPVTYIGMSFIAKFDNSGNVLWVKVNGKPYNSSGFSAINGICNDPSGNVIITGAYSGDSIYFGTTVLPPATQGTGILIIKYDTFGNIIFAKGIIGSATVPTGGAGGGSICTDNIGNIYFTGGFSNDSISFGSSTLVKPTTDSSNIIIVKLSPSGNTIWAKAEEETHIGFTHSLIYDPSGYLYIGGMFDGPSITIGSTTLTNTHPTFFIAKYDTTSNNIWAKMINGGSAGYGDGFGAIGLDATGNLYCTGGFSDSAFTFGTTTLMNSNLGFSDAYVLKMDSSGNPLYAVNITGAADDFGSDITIDNSGNVYIIGSSYSVYTTFGNITINSCIYAFIAKLGATTGIAENKFDGGLSISPNPFTFATTISFSSEQKNTTISITDLVGKEIKTISFSGKQCIIDKEEMSKGIYFVRITDEMKNVINRKIIIQ